MAPISIDTNIFVFGIRQIKPAATCILEHLSEIESLVASQVERELQDNLSGAELHRFYNLLNRTESMTLYYQRPPHDLIERYQKRGLKPGDAAIAGFCDWQNVATLISENRNFLQDLRDKPFEVVNADVFCRRKGWV